MLMKLVTKDYLAKVYWFSCKTLNQIYIMRRTASFPGKTMESLLPMREGGEGEGGLSLKYYRAWRRDEVKITVTWLKPPPPPAGDKWWPVSHWQHLWEVNLQKWTPGTQRLQIDARKSNGNHIYLISFRALCRNMSNVWKCKSYKDWAVCGVLSMVCYVM